MKRRDAGQKALPVIVLNDFLTCHSRAGENDKKLQNSFKKIYIALSGGMDSVVLLQSLLMSDCPKDKMAILHVDHQLQKQSAAWRASCEQLAAQHNLPCVTHVVCAKPKKGDSIEAFAREARYHFFKSKLKKDDLLLTAHHLDDQIETFFVNLLRGSGVEGLAGMQALSPLGKGRLGRPFLGLKRSELQAFAKSQQLTWHDDPSNNDTRFMRNFLRQDLLPVLATRAPAYRDTIARTMAHCREVSLFTNELTTTDAQQVIVDDALHIPRLKSLSSTRQNLVLKAWVKKVTGKMANSALLRELDKAMDAREDRRPKVNFLEFELVRKKEWLMKQ